MIQPDPDVIRLRNAATQATRDFFRTRAFCEVDTPVRIPAPAPELHIVPEPAGNQYLRTSPELHMKRLLAAGMPAIFQLGPCFRAGEYGTRHRPEFCMLEWYRSHTDYLGILEDMQQLIPHVAAAVPHARNFTLPWHIHTIQDIYLREAGWDPVTHFDPDRFDLDMVNIIEPALPHDRCTILIDYPAPVAALARRKPANPLVAERWELYAGGLELANAFSELTNPNEQRQRFQDALQAKAAIGEPTPPLDNDFLAALDNGLPPCAGVALGFDRLLMAITGAQDIATILPFPQ